MYKVLGTAPFNSANPSSGTACPGILIGEDWADPMAWSGCLGGSDCPSCGGEFFQRAVVVQTPDGIFAADVGDSVVVKLSEAVRLVDRDEWLSCLEGAGVDNWSGFDYAVEAWEATYGADTPLPE